MLKIFVSVFLKFQIFSESSIKKKFFLFNFLMPIFDYL